MRVGPYRVDVEVSDERVLVQYIDFGHDSEFKEMLPFCAREVWDLAPALRRDMLHSWHKSLRVLCPARRKGLHVSGSGMEGVAASAVAPARELDAPAGPCRQRARTGAR